MITFHGNPYYSSVCNIISKYNGIIRKVRQFRPSDSLPTLFNTLVYPYINYCAIIWADNNNSHRDSILLLQKRMVRTCTNSMWLEHTNPLFQSLNIWAIHLKFWIYIIFKLVFSYINSTIIYFLKTYLSQIISP